jgi:hypothetical protein
MLCRVMPNLNLRVTKWIGTVPAVGVCTVCSREFRVPVSAMKRVSDAQNFLKLEFSAHECENEKANADS